MANPLLQYNRAQLLDLRSAPRGKILPNKETLSILKDYNLLKYRGKRAGRPRTKSNAGIHSANLVRTKLDHTFVKNSHRQRKLKIATVNKRSIRNKSVELLQHIVEENINFCLITETWLPPDGDDVIRGELSHDGYCFYDSPRPDRSGGGVCILYRNNLKVSKISSKAFQSFECVEWKLSTQNFILFVVGIYRPPCPEKHPITMASFITEFTAYQEHATVQSGSMVILGDFTIHIDNTLG
jgi:hypothetical protein